MANISRDIYNKATRQDGVIFQQQKPLLDAELNLLQDILNNKQIDLAEEVVGTNYHGDSFKVYASASNNEIKVKKGIFIHKGCPLELLDDITITGFTTPVGSRSDTVFIEWYIAEVNSVEDPSIIDSNIGYETAVQNRIKLAVKVSEGSAFPLPVSNRNYIQIATLNRTAGNSLITSAMIADDRDKSVYSFIISGYEVQVDSGLNFKVTAGGAFVGDQEFFIDSTAPSVAATPSATGYAFINAAGGVEYSSSEPTSFHVLLATLITDVADITTIIDNRKFIPIAWNYKYGDGDSGETGYPSLFEVYKAGEALNKYDVVYISGASTVRKASASGNVPAIGICPQNIASGQIENVLIFGQISNSSWSWTANSIIYLDTVLGQLTQTPPTLTGTYTQRVGIAVTATTILFKPDLFTIKN